MEFDEVSYAYEQGYQQARAVTALCVIVQLCLAGALAIKDGAAYLDMDIVDLQETVRCMDISDVPTEEVPF